VVSWSAVRSPTSADARGQHDAGVQTPANQEYVHQWNTCELVILFQRILHDDMNTYMWNRCDIYIYVHICIYSHFLWVLPEFPYSCIYTFNTNSGFNKESVRSMGQPGWRQHHALTQKEWEWGVLDLFEYEFATQLRHYPSTLNVFIIYILNLFELASPLWVTFG